MLARKDLSTMKIVLKNSEKAELVANGVLYDIARAEGVEL